MTDRLKAALLESASAGVALRKARKGYEDACVVCNTAADIRNSASARNAKAQLALEVALDAEPAE